MTNFEKLIKEDVEVIKEAVVIASAFKNGKLVQCRNISCGICDYDLSVCKGRIKEWLDAEYKEPIKLNEQERLFCEMIEDGYFARDANNAFYWYKNKPLKGESAWDNCKGDCCRLKLNAMIVRLFKDNLHFDFVKWEDKEPWSVKELLETQNRTADE